MNLSDEGERCYPRAKELLSGWAVFEAEFQRRDAEPEGYLRVLGFNAYYHNVRLLRHRD